MGRKRKNKFEDPFTNRDVWVRANTFLSHHIKVGTHGVVFEWYNSKELSGDIVMLVKFDGRKDFFECEPHEVDFSDDIK